MTRSWPAPAIGIGRAPGWSRAPSRSGPSMAPGRSSPDSRGATPRGAGCSERALQLVEEPVLALLELVWSDVPVVAQASELLDLVGDVFAGPTVASLVAHRAGDGLADGVGAAGVGRVALHLAVDLVLDAVGVADVLEEGVALFARGLHFEVAGADDPLPDPLMEVDVA